MNNDKVNLHALPAWLKYLAALVVIAVVVWAARHFGGGAPTPGWVEGRLVPVLGWVYLALCVYLIIYYAARRIRRK